MWKGKDLREVGLPSRPSTELISLRGGVGLTIPSSIRFVVTIPAKTETELRRQIDSGHTGGTHVRRFEFSGGCPSLRRFFIVRALNLSLSLNSPRRSGVVLAAGTGGISPALPISLCSRRRQRRCRLTHCRQTLGFLGDAIAGHCRCDSVLW